MQTFKYKNKDTEEIAYIMANNSSYALVAFVKYYNYKNYEVI